MQFDHVAWRTERADIHDTNRPVTVEVVEEMPNTLTIIGRGPSKRQAVQQVQKEATRRGLEGAPDPLDYPGTRDALDTWCAVTWS